MLQKLRIDNWQWVSGILERGVLEIGFDQATVEVMAALQCGLQLKVRALCQQGLKRRHGRKHYGALEIENLVQKILLQTKSILICYCVERRHLWQRHSLLLTKQPCKYGLCWILFSFFFFSIDEAAMWTAKTKNYRTVGSVCNIVNDIT